MATGKRNIDYLLCVGAIFLGFLILSCQDPPNPSISPANATLITSQTQQFTAINFNDNVRWLVNNDEGGNTTVGTISSSGLYTAPDTIPDPSTVTIYAESVNDPSESATATVTIVNPNVTVSVSPLSVVVGTSLERQFTATVTGTQDQSVTWYVNDDEGGNTTVGTISSSGLYTAPDTIPDPSTMTIRATSVVASSASGTADVTIVDVIVTVSPLSATLAPSQTQQFDADVSGSQDQSATWYVNDIQGGNATVGTISSDGLYTAPDSVPSPSTLTVRAESVAKTSLSGTASVTIQDIGVSVSPPSATVDTSQTQQFTATVSGTQDQSVTWYVNDIEDGNATVGTISSGGLYTAPDTVPTPDTVTVKAESVADPSAFATATVTIISYVPPRKTIRVSINSAAEPGEGNSFAPSISEDGRYVAFHSVASNLVAGDTNGFADIFVHDRDADGDQIFDEQGTGEIKTVRVSVSTAGTEGNADSHYPSISADGRFVAFTSFATNLVPGDANGFADIFVHDRDTDGNGIFDEPNWTETVRVNLASGSLGEEANNNSYSAPSLSANGNFVAFQSWASNLVSGDGNASFDIFVRDLVSNVTSRVSVATGGTEGESHSYGPSISADGRYVAFYSDASNLVAGDTNGFMDVFRHDRDTGTTVRISVATDGTEGNQLSQLEPPASISADGRFVVFYSDASNLVAGDSNGVSDVFLRDILTSRTIRVSVSDSSEEGNAISRWPSISGDGMYVVFQSSASNLVVNDTNSIADFFVHDWNAGTTERVSVATDGTEANGSGDYSAISYDGTFVVFSSDAMNLDQIRPDIYGFTDIFVRELWP